MVGHEPLFEIVIPNWNGKSMLEHCLLSLRRQTYSGFRVIVVDNGSSDGSIELLENSFPEVERIQLHSNTGFSVAVNKGIESSTSPWLLLLNNDIEVAEDCLEKLRLAIEQYPQFQMFALKMMSFHQRTSIDGAGDAVLRGGVGYRLGTMEEDGQKYQIDQETFGACAGAALYHRNVFAKVGLFDDVFFAYLEDVDLNMRTRRHGLRCMYIAGAVVYHVGSASSGSKINRITVRLSTRNNIFVLVKNYPLQLVLQFLPAIFIYQLAWMIFCGKKGMLAPYVTGLYEAARMLPQLFKKRRALQHKGDLISVDSFANMIKAAEKQAVTSIMSRRAAAGKNIFLLSFYCNYFF